MKVLVLSSWLACDYEREEADCLAGVAFVCARSNGELRNKNHDKFWKYHDSMIVTLVIVTIPGGQALRHMKKAFVRVLIPRVCQQDNKLFVVVVWCWREHSCNTTIVLYIVL